jgi:hypothetical protein
MTMRFCDNLDCEYSDEPLERISDYRIVDGAVICIGCYEGLEEERQWAAANAELAESDTVNQILWGRR